VTNDARVAGVPRYAAAVTWVVAATIALIAALAVCPRLIEVVRAGRGLPLWDEAAQGFTGLELADAMRHARLIEWLSVLNRQVVWPFVHGLMLAPWFLVLGNGFDTPARMSVALFLSAALLAFGAGLALHPVRGAWAGAIAATLLLVAPLYHLFATLGMIETAGAFLLALNLALHARCAGRPASRGALIAAGASTAALFLLKYNYGLMWLAPLAAHEWLLIEPRARTAGRARFASWLRAGGWLRPMPLGVALWAVALLAILVTGGFEFALGGRRVSVRSAGNPAYALLLVLIAWLAASIARDPARWRRRWSAIEERHRVWLLTIAAPLLAWLAIPYPNRVKALAGFVVNRASGPEPWSLAGLAYYPRAFAMDYSPSPALGWAVLALSVVPPPRSRPAARLAYLALLAGLIATTLHRYHDPRFFFTTALLVWLNAGRAAVDALDAALARLPSAAREAAWAAALIATLAAIRAPSVARVEAARLAYRAPYAMLGVVDRVLDRAGKGGDRVTLLGYSYALSPGLLSWRAREIRPGLRLDAIPKRAPWLEAGAGEPRILARIEATIDRSDLILVALPEAGGAAMTPAYRSEVWADSVSALRLCEDPRVRLDSESELPGAGFRLWVFRKREAAPRPPPGEWM
jgi:hypothetical protein